MLKSTHYYLMAQILERAIRLEQCLEEAKTFEPRLYVDVIDVFLERVRTHIKKPLYSVITRLAKLELHSDAGKEAVFIQMTTAFHVLDELHNQLSFVLGSQPPPEIQVFISDLFSPFRNFIPDGREFNVVLSNNYMFEEIQTKSFDSNGKKLKGKVPTLFLPKIEGPNILQWGLLVHEMGHSLGDEFRTYLKSTDISKLTKGGTPESENIITNWVTEIGCDLISTMLLGPSYLASFIDFVTVIGSEGFLSNATPSHPPPRLRIEIMHRYLERNSQCTQDFSYRLEDAKDVASFFYHHFEKRCELQRTFLPIPPGKSIPIKINPLYRLIEKDMKQIVNTLEKKVVKINDVVISFLLKRLEDGIPIGCYPSTLGKTKHKFSSVDNTKNTDFLSLVKEKSSTIYEIYNAGWIYKYKVLYRNMITEWKKSPEKPEEFEHYFSEQIFRLDGLLRNSIETSYLVKLFSKN